MGRLIYLSHTRLDIAYAVGVVSQFMYDPREEHMQVIFRILHYLKASPRKGILFKKGTKLNIEVYADANYTGSLTDKRYTMLLHFSRRELSNLEE